LKTGEKLEAICCHSDCGPHFCDIGVSDNCNANINSYAGRFGCSYTNNTRLDGTTFFTGSNEFKVKEFEVLRIVYEIIPITPSCLGFRNCLFRKIGKRHATVLLIDGPEWRYRVSYGTRSISTSIT
jgi:hypothetical protein